MIKAEMLVSYLYIPRSAKDQVMMKKIVVMIRPVHVPVP
jgi:hypothetical protein